MKKQILLTKEVSIPSNGSCWFLFQLEELIQDIQLSLNPLKRVMLVSMEIVIIIPTEDRETISLNPLKRVMLVSIELLEIYNSNKNKVSIPSNGSCWFLL